MKHFKLGHLECLLVELPKRKDDGIFQDGGHNEHDAGEEVDVMPGLHVVAGLAGDLPLFRIFHHIIISVMTTSKNGITFYLTHETAC